MTWATNFTVIFFTFCEMLEIATSTLTIWIERFIQRANAWKMYYIKIQMDDKIGGLSISETKFSIRLCHRMRWKDVIDLGISLWRQSITMGSHYGRQILQEIGTQLMLDLEEISLVFVKIWNIKILNFIMSIYHTVTVLCRSMSLYVHLPLSPFLSTLFLNMNIKFLSQNSFSVKNIVEIKQSSW